MSPLCIYEWNLCYSFLYRFNRWSAVWFGNGLIISGNVQEKISGVRVTLLPYTSERRGQKDKINKWGLLTQLLQKYRFIYYNDLIAAYALFAKFLMKPFWPKTTSVKLNKFEDYYMIAANTLTTIIKSLTFTEEGSRPKHFE